jgi:hypothetical protein
VLPVLLLLVMGLVELALLLRAQLVLTNATREGARLASRGAGDPEVIERVMVAFSRQLPVRLDPQTDPQTGATEEANTGIIVTRFFVPGIVTDTGTIAVETTISPTRGIAFMTDDGMVPFASRISPDKRADFTLSDEEPDSTHDVVIVETYFQHNLVFYVPIEPFVQRYFPGIFVLYDRSTMRVSVPFVRDMLEGG